MAKQSAPPSPKLIESWVAPIDDHEGYAAASKRLGELTSEINQLRVDRNAVAQKRSENPSGRLDALATAVLEDPEADLSTDNSFSQEIARLNGREPVLERAKVMVSHRRTAAFYEASREACAEVEPHYLEILQGLVQALEGVAAWMAAERAVVHELSRKGYDVSALRPLPFGACHLRPNSDLAKWLRRASDRGLKIQTELPPAGAGPGVDSWAA